MNDVNGYNAAQNGDKKIIKIDKCSVAQRVRIINMSSHARFYFWFHDKRKFDIIELDGVSYEPKQTDMVEISSGQRVSIKVSGKNLNGECKWTYAVVASDPKISHG